MNKIEYNKISKSDFLELNEDDLMFITNPGRMGDEDGSTFVIKKGNEYTVYRVDGWMYPIEGKTSNISLNGTLKQFPKWQEAWKHKEEKEYNGKYKYLYMGFGNGLCVDTSIYREFEPYLNDLVDMFLLDKNDEDKKSQKYAAIYNVWEKAFINMINDKGYILK